MARGALWPMLSLMLLCGCTKKPLPLVRLESDFGALSIRFFDQQAALVQAFVACNNKLQLTQVQQDKAISVSTVCPLPQTQRNNMLLHLRGAVYQMEGQPNRLYIVQGRPITALAMQTLAQGSKRKYSDAEMQRYIRFGGAPELDGIGYPVGVVVDGLEVVDQLAALPTNADKQPLQTVSLSLLTVEAK